MCNKDFYLCKCLHVTAQCLNGSYSASGASACTQCSAGKYLTNISGATEAKSCSKVSVVFVCFCVLICEKKVCWMYSLHHSILNSFENKIKTNSMFFLVHNNSMVFFSTLKTICWLSILSYKLLCFAWLTCVLEFSMYFNMLKIDDKSCLCTKLTVPQQASRGSSSDLQMCDCLQIHKPIIWLMVCVSTVYLNMHPGRVPVSCWLNVRLLHAL